MRPFLMLAAVVTLFMGLIGPDPAFARVQSLPVVGADGMIGPLSVDQLDPEERARFATLPPGGDDARQFLYTRGFLRFCRLVVAGTIPPLQLPPLPARANWDRQFLSPDEAARVVDVAIGMKLYARMYPTPSP